MNNEGMDVSNNVEDGGGSGTQMGDGSRRLAEEFNIQRAKMKELFLQKEDEMRIMSESKQQMESEVAGLRAQLQQLQTLSQNQKSEIESLQMLIHETVEASSAQCSEDVRRLQTRNLELEQQLNLLTRQQASQQDASLAPAALVRTIARKLGADTEQEDAMRKAQEDAELLRSLVEPLEEEIRALKEKLRDTDTQLQTQLAAQSNKKSGKGDTKESDLQCDMCRNYEKQLVAEQSMCEEARSRARNAERALKIATEELEGARSVHEETVRAWRSERAAAAVQLAELRERVQRAGEAVQARAAAAEHAANAALQRVTALTVQRETLQEALDTLQRDNEMLVGKYSKKALEIQNEDINLPDNVEDLQECVLRMRDELIISSIGREEALTAEQELRTQLLQQGEMYHAQAASHAQLHAHYQQLRQQLDTMETERAQMKELGDKLRQSSDRIEELLESKKRSQSEVLELRARVSSLQQELDNSEKVQQDFVRLSQSLQLIEAIDVSNRGNLQANVQLERIREADTEVRWQHDEDVSECPTCHTQLPSKRKVHCRHCGRIFCASCVSHSVASGPRRAPARVCSVCRTLLQPHTAPYFSTEPPHTPD